MRNTIDTGSRGIEVDHIKAGTMRARTVSDPASNVMKQRRVSGGHMLARVSTRKENAEPPERGPARADLVERFDNGQLYLRAFHAGHYLWQTVRTANDCIIDASTWTTSRDLFDAYWINHGAFRRRSGAYYAIEPKAVLSRAA